MFRLLLGIIIGFALHWPALALLILYSTARSDEARGTTGQFARYRQGPSSADRKAARRAFQKALSRAVNEALRLEEAEEGRRAAEALLRGVDAGGSGDTSCSAVMQQRQWEEEEVGGGDGGTRPSAAPHGIALNMAPPSTDDGHRRQRIGDYRACAQREEREGGEGGADAPFGGANAAPMPPPPTAPPRRAARPIAPFFGLRDTSTQLSTSVHDWAVASGLLKLRMGVVVGVLLNFVVGALTTSSPSTLVTTTVY